MKYIDKFLKILKTDRTTFATYILTLLSVYLCLDRVVEILFIAFSGLSVDYWGPIKYTFALACPVFAFYFSFASKFITNKTVKQSFLYIYAISLYIMGVSMIVQWANHLEWFLLFSVPNYSYVISNFMDLIKPAFSAFAWYVPVCTFFPLFKWVYTHVEDTLDIKKSIWDYPGISLNGPSEFEGPFSCEIMLCKDYETGKTVKIPESKRFESTLVVGVSGSGKTSLVFEPLIARDIEKKYFYKEISKEMGYTALRTGIATLNSPYSNEYINQNFTLNMITPVSYKEDIFKNYFAKMLYDYNASEPVYKNLGITYMAPDNESITRIKSVAKNFNISYNLIDPNDNSSIGLNPFSFEDPIKTSIAVSSVLKRMYNAEKEDSSSLTVDDSFTNNVVSQAVENLTLLLKEIYPRLHDGDLPNIEDLYKLLNDFNKVEELTLEMEKYPELAEKYYIQITYFKKNFFSDAKNRDDLEKSLQAYSSQIENLLRYPGVKSILCNRTKNLNFDNALKDGEVTLICTRRGDLGTTIHRAFGVFIILLMQHSILSRPGNEKTRLPHFLYMDEFSPFICTSTTEVFTLYRKYRVGAIVSAQNLAQLHPKFNEKLGDTLTANCATKIVFGNNSADDNVWWEKELGMKREWKFGNDYKTDQGRYDSTYKSIEWKSVPNYPAAKIQGQKFKYMMYKTKNVSGKNVVGRSQLNFLEDKYKQPQKSKDFNFEKFSSGFIYNEKKENQTTNNSKFTGTSDNPNDTNPIHSNSSNGIFGSINPNNTGNK